MPELLGRCETGLPSAAAKTNELIAKHVHTRYQFGGKGNLDHQLKYPFGLSIDSDGNYIIADSGNKLVKIFSPRGQFLRKIAGHTQNWLPIKPRKFGYDVSVRASERTSVQTRGVGKGSLEIFLTVTHTGN